MTGYIKSLPSCNETVRKKDRVRERGVEMECDKDLTISPASPLLTHNAGLAKWSRNKNKKNKTYIICSIRQERRRVPDSHTAASCRNKQTCTQTFHSVITGHNGCVKECWTRCELKASNMLTSRNYPTLMEQNTWHDNINMTAAPDTVQYYFYTETNIKTRHEHCSKELSLHDSSVAAHTGGFRECWFVGENEEDRRALSQAKKCARYSWIETFELFFQFVQLDWSLKNVLQYLFIFAFIFATV